MKITAVTLLLLGAIVLVGDQLMKRSLRRTNFDPLAELFKARLGEVLTVPMSEPANLKDDAKLFDTYKTAATVARAAGELRLRGKIPQTSLELSALPYDDRLDAWGNPFCLVETGNRVAAISSGPRGDGRINCNELRIDTDQLSNLPSGRLYKYPSGVLIFVSEKR